MDHSSFGGVNRISTDQFLGFGFTPHRKPGRTPQSKVQAAAQALATRKARYTMGPKQKRGIKGVVPSATAQPAAPAPTVTTAPQPTIATGSTSVPHGPPGSSH